MKSLQVDRPHILVVVGLPGAGKTFFAKQFSSTFNAPYINYDHYRQLVGNDELGDKITGELLAQLLLTKQTIVMESIGSQRSERRDFTLFARKNGYEVLYIWVQTEPATTLLRAVSSKTATMTRSEFDERSNQFEILTKGENHLVISGKHTYASQAKVVLKRLVSARTESPSATLVPRPVLQGRGRIIIG
jgi:predicted kinase